MRFQIRSGVETPCKHYGQLIAGRNPFSDSAAALLEVADGQEDQLGRELAPVSTGHLGIAMEAQGYA